MAKTKKQKTADSKKSTALKIFGGVLFIALLSFGVLAAIKMLNQEENHEEVATEENKNTAEIINLNYS